MDDFDVKTYRPSEAARRRAEAAGLDLDRLRRDDPVAYAMMNAERVLIADASLLPVAGEELFAHFPGRQLFELPFEGRPNRLALLAFPPLSAGDLQTIDEAFGRRVAQPEFREKHAYYRHVQDSRGERRELALPTSPQRWQGEAGTLVGPFASKALAQDWAQTRVSPGSGLVPDLVLYGEAWFCDVFSSE